jgi:hypothetical protein
MITTRAMRGIHAWLHFCLSIGWPRSSLKGLTDLWWQYHDDEGNLTPANPQAELPKDSAGTPERLCPHGRR